MIGNPSTGWLGIDLGCDSIKMAQVRRQGRAFELIDAVAVPRSQNNWCNQKKSELSSSKDELLGGLSLGNGFRRGRASATVSPSISDVHIIEAAEDDPVRIHRALIETGISLDDCQVDSWPANYESEKKGTRTLRIHTPLTPKVDRFSRTGKKIIDWIRKSVQIFAP